MTIVHEVPTKLKLGLYSQDEVLSPNDRPAQPSSLATSFSLQQIISKQGGTIRQISYWATRFTGLHKPNTRLVQMKACPSGLK
jgi:hypothetical protein